MQYIHRVGIYFYFTNNSGPGSGLPTTGSCHQEKIKGNIDSLLRELGTQHLGDVYECKKQIPVLTSPSTNTDLHYPFNLIHL
jgi:hypothetical protein